MGLPASGRHYPGLLAAEGLNNNGKLI